MVALLAGAAFGAARTLHLPDVIVHARGEDDPPLLSALTRVARQWDERFIRPAGLEDSLPPTAPLRPPDEGLTSREPVG